MSAMNTDSPILAQEMVKPVKVSGPGSTEGAINNINTSGKPNAISILSNILSPVSSDKNVAGISEKARFSAENSKRLICASAHPAFEISIDRITRKWEIKETEFFNSDPIYHALHFLADREQNQLEDIVYINWTGPIITSNKAVKHKKSHLGKEISTSLTMNEMQELRDILNKMVSSQSAGKHATQVRYEPLWTLSQSSSWSKKTSPATPSEQYNSVMSYAENIISEVFHYSDPLKSFQDVERFSSWWNDYCKFNKKYARTICKNYQPNDMILVLDHQLAMVPLYVHQIIPEAKICLYMYSSFSSYEIIRTIPARQELLGGMAHANIIGFQTEKFARHFISASTRIMGYELTANGICADGRIIFIENIPFGIDPRTISTPFEEGEVDTARNRIDYLLKGRKLIVGFDRSSDTISLLQKFRAFKQLIEKYPHKRVLFYETCLLNQKLLCAESSIQELIQDIDDLCDDEHGSQLIIDRSPWSRAMYIELLRRADLCFVSNMRDGQSITALDYVKCQITRNPKGSMIVGEFCGTAEGFPKKHIFNPFNVSATAELIHEALSRSEAERESDMLDIFAAVHGRNILGWSQVVINTLRKIDISRELIEYTPPLDVKKLLESFNNSKRRLLALDYDGTLTLIRREPSDAIPTDRMLRALKILAQDERNRIWIISGRDEQFLEYWMGNITGLGFSAEHGSFSKAPGQKGWTSRNGLIDLPWKSIVHEIFQKMTDETQGSFIEEKKSAINWHYRKADPDLGKFRAEICLKLLNEEVASKYQIEVIQGKMCLEVRPKSVNKGIILTELIENYDKDSPVDFCLAFGDDRTDEDMFKVMHNHAKLDPKHTFSVSVGLSCKQTDATSHITSPEDVIEILSAMAGISER